MADCSRCGRPVKDAARYCLACGAERPSFGWSSPPAPPPPALQPPAQPPQAYLAPPPQPYQPAHPGPPPAPPRKPGKGMPWWGIVLIVLVVGAVVTVPVVLFVMPFVIVDGWVRDLTPFIERQQGLAQESAVKSGVRTIQTAVETWAADHDGRYPAPPRVTERRLQGWDGVSYIDVWPLDPYTGGDMTQGTGPGQFTYRLRAKGTSYRLVGYGEAGKVLITAP